MISNKLKITTIFIAMIGIVSTGYISSYFSDSDSCSNTISIKSNKEVPTEVTTEITTEPQTEIPTGPNNTIKLIAKTKGSIVDGIVGQGDVISPLEFDVIAIKDDGTEISLSPGELQSDESKAVTVRYDSNIEYRETTFENADAISIINATHDIHSFDNPDVVVRTEDIDMGINYYGSGDVYYGYDRNITEYYYENNKNNYAYHDLCILGDYVKSGLKSKNAIANDYTMTCVPEYLINNDYTLSIKKAPVTSNTPVIVDIELTEQCIRRLSSENTDIQTSISVNLTTDKDRAEIYAIGGDEVQHFAEAVVYDNGIDAKGGKDVSMVFRGTGSTIVKFSALEPSGYTGNEINTQGLPYPRRNKDYANGKHFRGLDFTYTPWCPRERNNGDSSCMYSKFPYIGVDISPDDECYTYLVQYIKSDIEIFDSLYIADMSNWFYGFTSLEKAPEIPSTVTASAYMFEGCYALSDLSNINGKQLSLMYSYFMFYFCPNLGDVDLHLDNVYISQVFGYSNAKNVNIEAKDIYNAETCFYYSTVDNISIKAKGANLGGAFLYNTTFRQDDSTFSVDVDKLCVGYGSHLIKDHTSVRNVSIKAKEAVSFSDVFQDSMFDTITIDIGKTTDVHDVLYDCAFRSLDINIGSVDTLGNLVSSTKYGAYNGSEVNININEVKSTNFTETWSGCGLFGYPNRYLAIRKDYVDKPSTDRELGYYQHIFIPQSDWYVNLINTNADNHKKLSDIVGITKANVHIGSLNGSFDKALANCDDLTDITLSIDNYTNSSFKDVFLNSNKIEKCTIIPESLAKEILGA